MSPFDTACGGKESVSQFDWSKPGILQAFNAATNQLDKIHHTVLPNPSEQLFLMPDTSKSNLCTGWVLYTKRDDVLLPVQYASAKLPKYMAQWCPCELEGAGTVVAIEQVRHWINESHHTTIVLPDNKPVVDAANLMKTGKYSKNARLQSLLTCVNRSNITFRHNSAKAGLHTVPDTASRLKTTCRSSDCQVERFLEGLPNTVQCMSSSIEETSKDLLSAIFSNLPVVAAVHDHPPGNLLVNGPLPLGSRQAWIEIQQESEICKRFTELKQLGQLPGRKDKNKTVLNKMLKRCEISKHLIVSTEFDDKAMRNVEKIFIPPIFLPSVLTIMDNNLKHPPSTQLQKLFEKYFVAFNLLRACQELSEQCSQCICLARFPRQLQDYDPQLVPLHPGSHMNIDVLKRSSQNILVNCDLFSGYVTAKIIKTEQRDDMSEGILDLVTPIRHSNKILLRVDRAPALRSLATKKEDQLEENGIKLELGDHFNKNSNCSVDKKIQELEAEILRLCPKETKLSTGLISQAVTNLNNRIRNQDMSAAQIHFSRDIIAGHNLHLNDKNLMEDKLQKRRANHPKSKLQETKKKSEVKATMGQLVYVREGLSKHEARDPLLVTGVQGTKVRVQKVLHSHDTFNKPPKITSEKVTVDEKFLYVPPHRRPGNNLPRGSSDDSWWRRGPSAAPRISPSTPSTSSTTWTPTHRPVDDDLYVDLPSPLSPQVQIHLDPGDEDVQEETEGTTEEDETSGGQNDDVQDEDTLEDSSNSDDGNDTLVDPLSGDDDDHDGMDIFEVPNNLELQQLGQGEEEEDEPGDQDHDEPQQLEEESEEEDGHLQEHHNLEPPPVGHRFPTKGKFIKFKRQVGSLIERDSHIPTDRYIYAQVTHTLKKDKFGRAYFNIQFPDLSTDGIYLAKGNLAPNDFIWDIVDEEEFYQLGQLDGATITPQSRTPNSSPEQPHDESIKSPLGIFMRRHGVRRRKLNFGGFSSRLSPLMVR